MTDDSLFHVLRTLVALVHIDSDAHPKEIQWVRELVAKQNLSPEQKRVIEEDFRSPPAFRATFDKVTTYRDQVELLRFAKALFHIDGNFHPHEKEAYDRLMEMHGQAFPNLEEMQKEMAKELVKQTERQELYRQLDEFGGMMTRRLSLFERFFTWWTVLKGLMKGNRYFNRLIIGLVVLYVLVLVLTRLMVKAS